MWLSTRVPDTSITKQTDAIRCSFGRSQGGCLSLLSVAIRDSDFGTLCSQRPANIKGTERMTTRPPKKIKKFPLRRTELGDGISVTKHVQIKQNTEKTDNSFLFFLLLSTVSIGSCSYSIRVPRKLSVMQQPNKSRSSPQNACGQNRG